MKKVFAILAVAAVVSACTTTTPTDTYDKRVDAERVRREAAVFAPLIFMTLWMGIYPEVFLQPIHLSILYLCA